MVEREEDFGSNRCGYLHLIAVAPHPSRVGLGHCHSGLLRRLASPLLLSPSPSLLTSRINSPTPLSLTPSSPSSSGPLLHRRRRRRRCRRQGNRLPLNLPPVPVLPPSTPPQWSRCVRPLMTDGRSRRRLLVSTHQSPNVPSLALYTVESLARLSRLTEARARCLTMYLLT